MWTETGSQQFYNCRSAYGTGSGTGAGSACLRPEPAVLSSYPETRTTVKTAPTGFSAPTMPGDLSTAFGYTISIPIPTSWPASYFPGVAPKSAGPV